ncbi:hypothetical protein DLJ53_15335 [Acuticoccus sediminis]|uniref:Uncharacterized protein n=1 Tax=Acuticoccus sediminis TaxID=2184697 RepID=A0A8B2NRD4_9HYPH|nr:heavy metal-binding domain-containing protein [Acuticoccus sediminis]RAI00629.1 hypothetical protein DLJ53_15335 [Acuticoccus sediminis]
MILSGLAHVEGYRVTRNVGYVIQETVLGLNVVRDFDAMSANLFGGRATLYDNKIQTARDDVISTLTAGAKSASANAIVGMNVRYDLGQGMVMETVQGTAVELGKLGDGDER